MSVLSASVRALIEAGPLIHLTTVNAEPGTFLEHHVVLTARATAEPSTGAWDVLDRLTKIYLGPDRTFPAPPGEGYVIRHRVEKVGGVGPWVPSAH